MSHYHGPKRQVEHGAARELPLHFSLQVRVVVHNEVVVDRSEAINSEWKQHSVPRGAQLVAQEEFEEQDRPEEEWGCVC